MPLSAELAEMMDRSVSPYVLGQWLAKNRAGVIEALEMDELTGQRFVPIPQVDLSDLPAFMEQRKARAQRGG